MKVDYARKKLEALLKDLDQYTDEEFERQMKRIIEGSTGREQVEYDWDYPREIYRKLLVENSPYAFYFLQWVPYQRVKDQITAQRWRLKMQHDVKHFDGRIEYGIWPNGNSCGKFKDDEVEFIRISAKQFGTQYVDPRKKSSGTISGIEAEVLLVDDVKTTGDTVAICPIDTPKVFSKPHVKRKKSTPIPSYRDLEKRSKRKR